MKINHILQILTCWRIVEFNWIFRETMKHHIVVVVVVIGIECLNDKSKYIQSVRHKDGFSHPNSLSHQSQSKSIVFRSFKMEMKCELWYLGYSFPIHIHTLHVYELCDLQFYCNQFGLYSNSNGWSAYLILFVCLVAYEHCQTGWNCLVRVCFHWTNDTHNK